MSVGCDEGTFRFPEKCDEVTLSPCIFCDAVTKISANREKMQGLYSSHDVYKPFSFWSVYFHNTKVLHPFFLRYDLLQRELDFYINLCFIFYIANDNTHDIAP